MPTLPEENNHVASCVCYVCNEANFRGPETVTPTAKAGGKSAIAAPAPSRGKKRILAWGEVWQRVQFDPPAFTLRLSFKYRFLNSRHQAEKPYHRHRFFFCRRRHKSEPSRTRLYRHCAPLPGRRTVFARFPASSPGGARPEGSHRPGGTIVPDI